MLSLCNALLSYSCIHREIQKIFIYMETGELILMGADCFIPAFLGGIVFEFLSHSTQLYFYDKFCIPIVNIFETYQYSCTLSVFLLQHLDVSKSRCLNSNISLYVTNYVRVCRTTSTQLITPKQ
jgi:hypothetical protein